MAAIQGHNGGCYAHAQTSNAYNLCLSSNLTLNLQEHSWDSI